MAYLRIKKIDLAYGPIYHSYDAQGIFIGKADRWRETNRDWLVHLYYDTGELKNRIRMPTEEDALFRLQYELMDIKQERCAYATHSVA